MDDSIDRRTLVGRFGSAAAVASTLALAGCGSPGEDEGEGEGGEGGEEGGEGGEGGEEGDSLGEPPSAIRDSAP